VTDPAAVADFFTIAGGQIRRLVVYGLPLT